MAAYVIVNVEVTDSATYEEYRRHTLESLQPFGGRFLVRGGNVTVLEGDWQPKRVVVIQFDSLELAQGWYNSERYQELKAIRQRSATTQMILTDGI